MPPKVKYTREEILEAALEMARADGFDTITARALGEKLGISSRPVFTAFQNMEEVQQEVKKAARKLYGKYVEAGLSQQPAFKGVGKQYIRFAKEEPKLFQLLFMSEQEQVPGISDLLPTIDDHYPEILESVQSPSTLDKTAALSLYLHLSIYTHGIAALCATKMCDFSDEEIDRMLTEVFISILKNKKAGEAK